MDSSNLQNSFREMENHLPLLFARMLSLCIYQSKEFDEDNHCTIKENVI